MSTTVYLIRHAESLSNLNPLLSNTPDMLSENGFKQAQSLANRFKDVHIEKIYVSNILRAQQTTQEIEKVTGVQPLVCEFLKEVSGSFSPELQFIHSESFGSLKKRIEEGQNFLENISENYIVIVSHAIFLKSLIAYFMLEENLTEESLAKITGTLVAENTGVSKLVFNKEKSKWRIMFLNDLRHLE